MTDYPPPAGQPTPSGSGGSSPYGAAGSPPPPPPPPPLPSSSTMPSYGPGYVSEPDAAYSSGGTGWGAAPPPPVAESGGYGTKIGERPGELLDRFVARLIDHVLIGVVNAAIVTAIVVGMFLDEDAGLLGYGESFVANAVGSILSVVLSLGYFVYMETQRGRTIGKIVMKLRVDSDAGGPPTVEQSVKRNIWMVLPILGIIPLLGGLVSGILELIAVIMIAVGINSDTLRRRPWTDNLAGTQVIKEG